MDASLPFAAPHDESNGIERRSDDPYRLGYASWREHARGDGYIARRARGSGQQSAEHRTRTRRWVNFGNDAVQWAPDAERSRKSDGQHARHGSFEDSWSGSRRRNEHASVAQEREPGPALSTGRFHGRADDGDGQGGRKTRDVWAASRVERIRRRDDDSGPGAAAGPI